MDFTTNTEPMMKNFLIAIALFIIACSSVPAESVRCVHAAEEAQLCDVLATIKDGEHRTITLSGIYAGGYEHGIFYDPSTPKCQIDVQPETWVELAPGVKHGVLDRFFRTREGSWETRRVYATLTGDLYGPGIVASDDLALPQMAAFANRTRTRRYGHLSGYRTKFVVTSISGVKNVPEAIPWPAGSAQSVPIVERAIVPQYPTLAWNVGITGDVVLEVTVSSGQVVNVEVKSGERMLTGEAIRNVKTWQLPADTNATFTTTFSFNVEPRKTGENAAPRIELQLPQRVRITAPRNGW